MAQVELNYLVDKEERKHVGRFLGFIKDDEFNAICQSKIAAGKIESKETKSLTEVCQKHDDLIGYRIVIVIKETNGEPVLGKKLFISEKLDYISLVNIKDKMVVFISEDENNLVMKEIE